MLGIAILNSSQHHQCTFELSPVYIRGRDTQSPDGLAIDDPYVSPLQCEVHWLRDQHLPTVRLVNLGQSLVLTSGSRLHHRQSIELDLPATLQAGDTQIHFFDPEQPHSLDTALRELPVSCLSCEPAAAGEGTEPAPSAETLSSWFEALGHLQRSVAGSKSFFKEAARAVFNPGGLDGCMILQPADGDRWNITASHIAYPEHGIMFRKDLVDRAAKERCVVFHDNSQIEQNQTGQDIHSAVVCPALDQQGAVAAVVYGFRDQHRTNKRRGIRSLEARFVSLVADAVSAGLIRMDREADAARTHVLLEQAFAPKVVRLLEHNPKILEGQDREVSILFSDLRGFSALSEKVGTRVTYQLLSDVMEHFSRIVSEHDGVIIDYYGDGLSAFWNAPIDQPDHALLACTAAIAIADCMPEINQVWSSRLSQILRVGIGVHTGIAQVGNSGSRRRLKYGPRGHAVNLASRLEHATKCLNIPLLVSGTTAEQVSDRFIPRRICSAQLAGLSNPTELFQLVEPTTYAGKSHLFQKYEQALQAYEQADFTLAIQLLTDLQISHESDTVVEFLLRQAVNQNEALDQVDKTGAQKKAISDKDHFAALTAVGIT